MKSLILREENPPRKAELHMNFIPNWQRSCKNQVILCHATFEDTTDPV